MKASVRALHSILSACAVLAGLGMAGQAHATNHALIMWIGDYGNPRNNLPGIEYDAQAARRIAQSMGVPAGNIREVSNAQLTKSTIAAELSGLHQRIAQGDKVFIYYSGHGHQVSGVGGARCTEALVSREPALYPDFELQDHLTRLGNKASQVVMMNDSCFSGGAATKDMTSRSLDAIPKYFADEIKGSTAVTPSYQCGDAVNKMARNLEPVAARTRVLYLAASSDTEVSYASSRGSYGTLAWAACLSGAQADANRSGSITGKELKACAQQWINQNSRYRQTVFLQGDEDLPLSFTSASSGGGGGVRVDPVQSLRDIANGGAKDFQVTLSTPNSNLRIKQDFLDFSVTSSRSGYLYVLQVGSDGRTFNLLFPNKFDQNNQIGVGTHQFPRPSWRVRAGGPAGTSHLLAVVTQTPKDISKDMDLSQAFPSALATDAAFKTLVVEAAGNNGGSGGYGASAVVAIREVQ